MVILAIDASGATAGVALVNEYITIGEITVNANTQTGFGAKPRKTHSEILLPMIDQLLTFAGMTLAEVDYLACTNGPGSFTGLRIGAATAKGLACGAGKPLIAVPTLDALAYNIPCADGTWIVPWMDARRMAVYTAFYRCENGVPVRRSDYMAEPVEYVLALLSEAVSTSTVWFLGDGVPPYAESLARSGLDYRLAAPGHNRQRAAAVGVCALRLAGEGQFCAEADFPLLYIRKPQAERERDERGAT